MNRSPRSTPNGDSPSTCEYRLVRDRDRFRYGIHAVHYDSESGDVAAWTPQAVRLETGTPAELKELLELTRLALTKPILDREDLGSVLEVFPEPPSM